MMKIKIRDEQQPKKERKDAIRTMLCQLCIHIEQIKINEVFQCSARIQPIESQHFKSVF